MLNKTRMIVFARMILLMTLLQIVSCKNDELLDLPADTVVPTDINSGFATGNFSGTFSVGSDGAANYFLPLWVTPGRAGMEPHLSLEYNSRGNNGMLGVGWQLGGFSSINRCRQFIALDGFTAPVRFGAQDEFTLDGKRLLLVKGRPGSDGAEYRSEQDDFSRVILHDPDARGAGWFEVWKKDGEVWEYGHTADSKIISFQMTVFAAADNPEVLIASPNKEEQRSPIISSWQVSKMKDRSGNAVNVKWKTIHATAAASPGTSIQVLPEQVSYTASENGSGSLPSKFARFSYENRTDRDFQFNSGLKTELFQRLKGIEIWAPDGSKQSLIRSYKFAYVNNSITQRSLLQSVTTSDGQGVKLPPLTFEWQLGTTRYDITDTHISDISPVPTDRWITTADLNGDGRDDLLYLPFPAVEPGRSRFYGVRLSNGTGFDALQNTGIMAPVSGKRPGVINLNGDTRADLLVFQDGALGEGSEDVPCLLNTALPDNNPGRVSFTLSKTGDKKIGIAADVNGDELTDFIQANEQDPSSWEYVLNENGSLSAPEKSFTGPLNEVRTLYQEGRPELGLPDLDGDGSTELVGISSTSSNHPSAFELGRSPRVPEEQNYITSLNAGTFGIFMDVNADGLPELVSTSAGNFQPIIQYNVGKWHANSTWTNIGMQLMPGFLPFDVGMRVMDYNSDGKEDLLARPINSLPLGTNINALPVSSLFPMDHDIVLQSSSAGFIPLDPGIGDLSGSHDDLGLVQPLDIDGDGLDDLLVFSGGTFKIFHRRGKLPDQLISVTDGFGARTTIEYSPLSDAAVYHTDQHAVYPQMNINSKLWVVSADHQPDGIGGTVSKTYHYANGIRDRRGRGWLGFETMTINDLATGATKTSTYNLSANATNSYYPFVGTPVDVSESLPLGNGKQYAHHVSVEYSTHEDWAAGFYFSWPAKVTETIDEGTSGAMTPVLNLVTTMNVDDFGNPVTIEEKNGDGEIHAFRAVYENKLNEWLVNRIIRLTESSIPKNGGGQSRVTGFEWDAKGLLYREISEPGLRVNGVYEALTQPQPDGIKTFFTKYERATDGQITVITSGDPADPQHWRTARFKYDVFDRTYRSAIQNGVGQWTKMRYHPGLGVIAAISDPNKVTSYIRYDGFGRVRGSKPQGAMGADLHYAAVPGSVTTDGNRFLRTVTVQSDGKRMTVDNDVLGRPVSTQTLSGLGNPPVLVENQYDRLGRLVRESAPRFNGAVPAAWSAYLYDPLGRMLSVTEPDGKKTTLNYDGRTIRVREGTDIERDVLMDGSGRIASITEYLKGSPGDPPQPFSARYEYGPFNVIKNIAGATGKPEYQCRYDRLGRKILVRDSDVGERRLTWSVFNQLEGIAWKEGAATESIQYAYDKQGRPVLITSPQGKTYYEWDQSANGIGRIHTATSTDGIKTTFGYNTDGNPISTTWLANGETYALSYELDAMGRTTKMTYPHKSTEAPFSIGYKYSSGGALEQISDLSAGQLWTALANGEDGLPANPSGRFVQATLGNGLTSRMIEDPALNRMKAIITKRSDGTALVDLEYKYDDSRNIIRRSDNATGFDEAFEYDGLDRLHRWSVGGAWNHTENFDYDQLGNLVSRTPQTTPVQLRYGQNGAGRHAVTERDGAGFEYNDKGNQVKGPGRSINFNAWDLPVTAQTANGKFDFQYDAFQNRIVKSGAGNLRQVSIGSLYESSQRSGAEERRFIVYAEGQPVAMVVKGGNAGQTQTFFLSADELGSITMMTDQSGQVINRQKYDPWGNRLTITGSPVLSQPAQRLGFAGQLHDDDLGMINMIGRVYDPQTTRFLSPDPVTDYYVPASINRYQYAYNNPVKWTDPLGLQVPRDDISGRLTPVIDFTIVGDFYQVSGEMASTGYYPGNQIASDMHKLKRWFWRAPDYYSLNYSWLFLNVSLTMDRNYRTYGGVGFNYSMDIRRTLQGIYSNGFKWAEIKAALKPTMAFSIGKVDERISEEELADVVGGMSYTGGYSFGPVGINEGYSSGHTSTEVTIGTSTDKMKPGWSGGVSYSKEFTWGADLGESIFSAFNLNWMKDTQAEKDARERKRYEQNKLFPPNFSNFRFP